MDDQKLLRNLRSIGMACYVAYHREFADFSNADNTLIGLLIETEGYTPTASATRVIKSREILRAGRDRDALRMITEAPRVAPGVVQEARRILDEDAGVSGRRAAIAVAPNTPGPADGKMRADEPSQFPFVRQIATSQLLALYAEALDELREREIVRTANGPGGDYAELLSVRAFGWERAANSAAGYDAIDTSGLRYQVKSRRIVSVRTSRQLSALRNLIDAHFDFLVGVLFNKDYSILRAAVIPHEIVKTKSRFSQHTNSSIFFLDDSIWQLPGVRDITIELQKAAESIDSESQRA